MTHRGGRARRCRMSYSPYAPPQAGPHIAAYYRPLGWKTTVGAAAIVAAVVLGLLGQLSAATLGQPNGSEHLAAALAFALVGLLGSAVHLFASVLFLVWTHNAALNVRAFGQGGFEFTPGWCVGWWFIPIASLWKPYQALKEIWRASDPEAVGTESRQTWQLRETPALFPLWWASYLGSGFIGAIGGLVVAIGTWSGEPSSVGPALVFASVVVSGIAAYAIFRIMRDLGLRQSICAEKLGLSPRV